MITCREETAQVRRTVLAAPVRSCSLHPIPICLFGDCMTSWGRISRQRWTRHCVKDDYRSVKRRRTPVLCILHWSPVRQRVIFFRPLMLCGNASALLLRHIYRRCAWHVVNERSSSKFIDRTTITDVNRTTEIWETEICFLWVRSVEEFSTSHTRQQFVIEYFQTEAKNVTSSTSSGARRCGISVWQNAKFRILLLSTNSADQTYHSVTFNRLCKQVTFTLRIRFSS